MIGFLFLTLLTTFQPAHPTVGDPITITFAAPTTVDPSNDYEVVSRSGNTFVIRSFVPHSITVTGRSAGGPISVAVPIHSVLKPDDKLEPAPLKPPKPELWPRLPFIVIGIAALAAIGVWIAVVLLARRRMTKPHVVVVPAEQFRNTVLTLRNAPMRWARLADAVRAYLAAVRTDWGAELTTSELLEVIESEEATERRRPAGWTAAGPAATSNTAGEPPAVQRPSRRRSDASATSYIATILRQGDLEKFSPWGAAPHDFDELATHALEIPAWAEPPVVVQDEVAA